MAAQDVKAATRRLSRTLRIDLLPRFAEAAERSGLAPVSPAPAAPKSAPEAPPKLSRQDFLKAVYDGVVVAQKSGEVIDANSRAIKYLQYDAGELQSLTVAQIVAGAEMPLLQQIMGPLAEGRFALLQGYCVRKDGSFFPAEIAVSQPRFEPEYLYFFMHDMTVHKEAEDRMRTGHAAMQNAAAGIAILDGEGKISYANPALNRMWKADGRHALEGQPFSMLVQAPEAVNGMLQVVRRPGDEWKGEMLAVRRGEELFAVQVAAACNCDADGEVNGTVVSVVDVTESKRATEAIREAVKHEAMLASLSAACHHLAQPATALIGSIHLLHDAANLTPEQLAEVVASSAKAADDLSLILRKLSAVNRYRTVNYISEPRGGRPTQMLDIHSR
jgi:PAS domain S-box-containing protein